MKNLIAPVIIAAFLLSCANSNAEKNNADTAKKDSVAAVSYFGDTITADGAIAVADVEKQLAGKDSMQIKLTGKILDVCQKKGCWMALDLGNNKSMRVTFKDYGFFVPKDCGGKTAIVDGYAHVDTTSVADLREYAKDGGASKDSIAKITQPEVELSFEARGVIIK